MTALHLFTYNLYLNLFTRETLLSSCYYNYYYYYYLSLTLRILASCCPSQSAIMYQVQHAEPTVALGAWTATFHYSCQKEQMIYKLTTSFLVTTKLLVIYQRRLFCCLALFHYLNIPNECLRLL